MNVKVKEKYIHNFNRKTCRKGNNREFRIKIQVYLKETGCENAWKGLIWVRRWSNGGFL
jgi:hypothetical protein